MTRIKYLLARLSLVVIGIVGAGICLFWYPFSTAVNFGYLMPDAIVNTSHFYATLCFYLLASIPCFYILFIVGKGIRKTYRLGNNINMSMPIRVSIRILSIDIFLFLIGNIVLDILRLNTFSFIYYLLALSGIIICLVGWRYNERILKALE